MKPQIHYMTLSDTVNFITVTQIKNVTILRLSETRLSSQINYDIGIWKIKYKPKN